MGNLSSYLQILTGNKDLNASFHYKEKFIPPEAAMRSSQAPFLFKCCRVDYNKETNRLELPRGEYVGKTVVRNTDLTDSDEEDEYDDILVEATDQTDLAG